MGPSVLAVIPARGGSTRVPRKNIREVDGKPLVAHTINHAAASEMIDDAIVSTDDDEIASVARDYGGTVPFERPAELATDTAPTAPVLTHALEWVEENWGRTYDILCLLQVTSPLRTPGDIDAAVTQLQQSDAETLVSVSEYLDPPQWALTTTDDGSLTECFEPDMLFTDDIPRTQDVPDMTHPNGAIFLSRIPAWYEEETFYTDRTIGYEMPPKRSVDIDELWELELVRQLMEIV